MTRCDSKHVAHVVINIFSELYKLLVWIRNQLDVTYMLSFISPLQVAQHVSGNHAPIFRSCATNSSMDTLPANRF